MDFSQAPFVNLQERHKQRLMKYNRMKVTHDHRHNYQLTRYNPANTTNGINKM